MAALYGEAALEKCKPESRMEQLPTNPCLKLLPVQRLSVVVEVVDPGQQLSFVGLEAAPRNVGQRLGVCKCVALGGVPGQGEPKRSMICRTR
ncbi:hypothetical protein GCM10010112_57810 [Actinoplanes lobatus]|uniref:Uncharacterized protein n=1 Tax=Actinoplanes lobatus TaxID=113568 RepID=A0ABQ4AKX9_9ACTN|nr:hypothetical protein GCM10010112_57810 [Actinoplanes lobatus]GIE41633.1 hypothetical protein Alo02nite_45310 [Actinoplanes lobatus]